MDRGKVNREVVSRWWEKSWMQISLLLLLTLCMRLLLLGAKPLWLDEAKMVMLSMQSPQTIFFGIAGDIHPPAAYLFLHYWQMLFGTSEFAFRLPSAILVSFSLIPILLMVRRVADKSMVWWTGLIFALSPYTLYLGQEVRTYAYAAFFCAWLVYFTILIVQGYGWKGYLGFGLTSLGALHLHHLTAGLVGGLAIYLCLYEIINRKGHWWWVTPLLAFSLTLLLYLPQMLATISQIRLFAGEVAEIQEGGSTLGNVTRSLVGAFFHFGSGNYFTSVDNYSLARIFTNPWQTAFLIICGILPQFIFLLGIISWTQLAAKYRWLLFAGLVTPWLVTGYFINSARQFVPMLPVYIFMLGLGLWRLSRRGWGKAVITAFLLFNSYIVVDYYLRPIMPTQHRYLRNFRQAGEFLINNARTNDFIYLHLDHYSVLDMRYYLRNSTLNPDSYYRDFHFEHIIHNEALDYINKVDLWGIINSAHKNGMNVWLVANDPRMTTEPLITKSKDLNLGIDSDKACDIRLFELSQHYPQAVVKDSPGDILRIFFIPVEGSK